MIQYVLTPAAGKRLIAKAVAGYLADNPVISTGTIVIVAGTTNGYVVEELLALLGQGDGFYRDGFYRGLSISPNPNKKKLYSGHGNSGFSGDVIIKKGLWQKGLTIFDVVDDLVEGDIILKGANCVDIKRKKAGILIGDPKGGTIMAALKAVMGKRVRLILPVGLEKRISNDIDRIACKISVPGNNGLRLMPVNGEIITEIEALRILCGTSAELIAGGGVYGAEGAIRIAIYGNSPQLQKTSEIVDALLCEPLFGEKF